MLFCIIFVLNVLIIVRMVLFCWIICLVYCLCIWLICCCIWYGVFLMLLYISVIFIGFDKILFNVLVSCGIVFLFIKCFWLGFNVMVMFLFFLVNWEFNVICFNKLVIGIVLISVFYLLIWLVCNNLLLFFRYGGKLLLNLIVVGWVVDIFCGLFVIGGVLFLEKLGCDCMFGCVFIVVESFVVSLLGVFLVLIMLFIFFVLKDFLVFVVIYGGGLLVVCVFVFVDVVCLFVVIGIVCFKCGFMLMILDLILVLGFGCFGCCSVCFLLGGFFVVEVLFFMVCCFRCWCKVSIVFVEVVVGWGLLGCCDFGFIFCLVGLKCCGGMFCGML